MYTCRTGYFGNDCFCLCFFWLCFFVLYFFLLYFSCYILFVVFSVFFILSFILFRVVLKPFHSLWQFILLFIRQIFCTNLKLFSWKWELVLIHQLVIFLCLFKNNLIVSKLNCLLLFLLILLIFSLYKWYCPIIYSIGFHFHHHHIIKFIVPSFIAFISHYLFFL